MRANPPVLLTLCLLACLDCAQAVGQVTAPEGWVRRATRGMQTYAPVVVPSGGTYAVAVLDAEPAGHSEPAAWLGAKADNDAAALRWQTVRRGPVSPVSSAVLTMPASLRTRDGTTLVAIYYRIAIGVDQVRLARVVASSAELLQQHRAVTAGIIQRAGTAAPSEIASSGNSPTAVVIAADTSRAATPVATTPAAPPTVVTPASNRGAARPAAMPEDVSGISRDMFVSTPAPRRNGLVAGGTLVTGMYVGKQQQTDTREVRGEMTVWLYANGEYRQAWKSNRDNPREADFSYDPGTGRIDLRWGSLMDIENSRIDPDVDFAVFAKMSDGTPVIFAENDRGYATLRTLLVRVGPNDQPSPSSVKAAEEAAEAEAARYKFVLAPGQGVQDAQIARIQLFTELHRTMGLSMQMGISSTLSLYLLLTDGTIHDGLPVAPDELDVVTSRRREPEKWGRWRMQGDKVFVSWSVAPNEWKELEGEAMVKARQSEALRGRFSGGQSHAAGDVASFSLYGVTFGDGQRFETDSRGGTGTGGFTQTMSGTSIQTTRDDDGSVTTASTPNVVVSAEQTRAAAARSGTYRIRGWNLEATYGDGRVVRQPFFFIDDKRDAVYWQGAVVNLDTGRP